MTVVMSGGGITLPRYLGTTEGALIEGLEDTANWTTSTSTRVANTSEFVEGAQSIKFTPNAGGLGSINKTGISHDLSGNWKSGSVDFYVHDALADYAPTGTFYVRFSANGNLADSKVVYAEQGLWLTQGWHRLVFGKDWAQTIGAGTWDSPITRINFRAESAAGKTPSISVDNLRIGRRSRAAVIFRFDDGYITTYNQLAYMRARNIRGTVALIGKDSYLGVSTHMSWAQARALYDAGWTMAIHSDVATYDGMAQAAIEADIADVQSQMIAHGMTRGVGYFVDPGSTSHTEPYGSTLHAAMTARGIVLGVEGSLSGPVAGNLYPAMEIPHTWQPTIPFLLQSNNATTQSYATVVAWIDAAISSETVMQIHLHDLDLPGNMTQDTFRQIVDYVRLKKDQGVLVDLTLDDYFQLTLGSWEIPA